MIIVITDISDKNDIWDNQINQWVIKYENTTTYSYDNDCNINQVIYHQDQDSSNNFLLINYYRVDYYNYVPVAIGIQEVNEDNAILVYPNPSTGTFNLEFKNSLFKDSMIEIFNSMGEKVYSQTVVATAEASKQIQIKSVPGIYFLKITTSDKNFVRTVIIK